MQITVQVNNLAAVQKALRTIGSNIPKVIQSATNRMATEAVNTAKIYPPPPENSRYVRTYTFRNAWRITPSGSLGVMIRNDASQKGRMYPVFVMGNDVGSGQASIHSGRWSLFINNVTKEAEKMDAYVVSEIQTLIKAKGL
jgi:hypothetical protein